MKKYIASMNNFLREGEELFTTAKTNNKILPQLSEKYWGAIIQLLKAFAAKENKELLSHSSIWNYVQNLTKKFPNIEIKKRFSCANTLHINFYENMLTYDTVEEYTAIVKALINELIKFL